ncbi:transcription initiation factor TFIID subunit 4 isoform X2 [Drosophila grimshawi]|uniref:GH16163 n=1 Tax=Drosophila grimshawi TaxID=7222 RepID=B4IWQ0_DROGR|nr:transcription initiation factor TFIID subunit 4 isoform X2 [Drosophila grimshawi]EDV96276.1 GH16163 [Drosophila grimshawi]
MNSSQTAPTATSATSNRITFTTQPLPNGTINIGGPGGGGVGGPTIISTAQLPNTTTIKTITAGMGGHGVPGLSQVHHQVQHQQQQQSHPQQHQQHQHQHQTQSSGQPLLNSMLPAGVVVGMRPQAPTQQQPKNMPANPLSRVVISNSHMAGVRPQSPSINLGTLHTGQTPALLVKTDNGFQLLRVGTATTSGPPTMTQTISNTSNNNNNNTNNNNTTTTTTNHPITTQIRLQTVPAAAVSRYHGQSSSQQLQQQQQQQQSQQLQQQQKQQQQQHQTTTQASSQATTASTSIALRKTIVRTSSTILPSSNNNNNNNNNINNTTTTTNNNTTTITNNNNNKPATNLQHQQQQQQKLQLQLKQQQQAQQQHKQQQQQQASVSASSAAAAAAAAAAANVAATIKIKQNSMTNTTASSNIIVNSVASTNAHSYSTATQPPHLAQLQHQQQAPHLPQVTQIQTIPAQGQGQHQQQQQHSQANHVQVATAAASVTAAANANATTTTTAAQGNTKEKCRKFLANLIELSTREPKQVEKNVRTLIQELVNATVEPEEFCDRLERLLNASPQPCLIGFLKKSLPLLRQALYTKELIIEGIKPPPQHVLGLAGLPPQLPKIQAQIRPIGLTQTTTIGQTQVRMITPNAIGTPRPTIGHTTISKQPPNIRLPTAPRLAIRGQMPSLPMPAQANIVQIRGPTNAQLQRTGAVQIRATPRPPNSTPTNKVTAVKVGQTQIKAITPSLHPPSLAAISSNSGPPPTPTLSVLSTINSASTTSLPVPSLPTVHLPPEALRAREQMQNSLHHNNNNHFEPKLVEIKAPQMQHIERINASLTPISAKTMPRGAFPMPNKSVTKKKRDALDRDGKDEKVNSGSGTAGSTAAAAAAANSFFQQSSMSSSIYGDDDINDVAAMGGVNLAEESQRILGCTENIGTQIRSCKDEVFLNMPALLARLRTISAERGLEEPSQDVAVLISHACQERLKNVVEKLAVIAEHRIDVIKLDPRYEPAKDVRGQIKFLEELDKAEQKRHEELEREMLLRAAKSRTRVEDPEQAKMKARAKEMQRAEMEELRQRDANLTALQAIGPRKKLKLDSDTASAGVGSSGGGLLSNTGTTTTTLRPRIKRVNLRDMLFFMEQEREFCRSTLLLKTYLK